MAYNSCRFEIGGPITEEGIARLVRQLVEGDWSHGWGESDFYPDAALAHIREAIAQGKPLEVFTMPAYLDQEEDLHKLCHELGLSYESELADEGAGTLTRWAPGESDVRDCITDGEGSALIALARLRGMETDPAALAAYIADMLAKFDTQRTTGPLTLAT